MILLASNYQHESSFQKLQVATPGNKNVGMLTMWLITTGVKLSLSSTTVLAVYSKGVW